MQAGYAVRDRGGQAWEYRWEVSPPRRRPEISDAVDAAMLQSYGDQGWELVSVFAVPIRVVAFVPWNYNVWYYFKRPKVAIVT